MNCANCAAPHGCARRHLRRAEMPDMISTAAPLRDPGGAFRPSDSPLRDLDRPGGMARFLPWGMRLAALLEECANQMAEIRPLDAVDGVLPFAAACWRICGINDEWLKSMREAGLSTRGLEAGQTALAAREEPPLPPALEGRALFLAGFVRLTASEDMLFRCSVGARRAYLPAQRSRRDPGRRALVLRRSPGLDTRLERRGGTGLPSFRKCAGYPFFAGYDLHSQLAELASAGRRFRNGAGGVMSGGKRV